MSSIQAYASRASVSPENPSTSWCFTITGIVIRIYDAVLPGGGRWGAAGEIPVGDPITRLWAEPQAIPPDFNEHGCRWPVPYLTDLGWINGYRLAVPNDWTSGV